MRRVIPIIASCCLVFGQSASTRPKFVAADVHAVQVHGTQVGTGTAFRAMPIRDGRYQLKNASMLDLLRTAYGFEADRILGGPSWLEMDRFEIIAKLPGETTPDMQKLMLQTLLEDHFKLVVHKDMKPLTGYALTAGKKPTLKRAAVGGQSGCVQQRTSALGNGLPITYNCRNMTMAAFAQGLNSLFGTELGTSPVFDETGLTGAWNFDLSWTLAINGGVGDGSAGVMNTIFDAIDKLGLKLEKRPIPMSVLVVDRVNRTPKPNAPDLARLMPPIPQATHFEVASVKPNNQGSSGPPFQFHGDRLTIRGAPMKWLLESAFRDTRKSSHVWIVGSPDWTEFDRFEILAKAPPNTAPLDLSTLGPPLLALLKERFKLAYHLEQRPENAYTLEADGPKMKKANPAVRTSCRYSPAPARSAGGSQMLACQNITMAQFAEWLTDNALGLRFGPVSDGTSINGARDFSLTFNLEGFGPPSNDPIGGYNMFEALKKQLGLTLRRTNKPQPVIVIDHIERKPTEN